MRSLSWWLRIFCIQNRVEIVSALCKFCAQTLELPSCHRPLLIRGAAVRLSLLLQGTRSLHNDRISSGQAGLREH